MSELHKIEVNGVERFGNTTLGNAGQLADKLRKRLPGATVKLIPGDAAEFLVNPKHEDALAMLADLGIPVLAVVDNETAPPARPTRAPRKPVAAAKKK